MKRLITGAALGAAFALAACGGDTATETEATDGTDAMAGETLPPATDPAFPDAGAGTMEGTTTGAEDGMDPGAAGDPASGTTTDDTTGADAGMVPVE